MGFYKKTKKAENEFEYLVPCRYAKKHFISIVKQSTIRKTKEEIKKLFAEYPYDDIVDGIFHFDILENINNGLHDEIFGKMEDWVINECVTLNPTLDEELANEMAYTYLFDTGLVSCDILSLKEWKKLLLSMAKANK